MAFNNDSVSDPTVVRIQYDDAGLGDPNIPIIIGPSAVVNINGGVGPIITINGGSTGLTFSTGSSTIAMAGTLVAANGGTGNSSYTKGDLLAASAAATLTKLSAGSNTGQVLSVDPTTATGLAWITGEIILATTTLDLDTSTKQTLYTVPAGKSAVVTKVLARSSSGNLSGGATGFLSLGFNAGATDWGTGLLINQITASTQFIVFTQEFATVSGVSVIGTTGQVFGTITDAPFGSAATVVIEVYGHTF